MKVVSAVRSREVSSSLTKGRIGREVNALVGNTHKVGDADNREAVCTFEVRLWIYASKIRSRKHGTGGTCIRIEGVEDLDKPVGRTGDRCNATGNHILDLRNCIERIDTC